LEKYSDKYYVVRGKTEDDTRSRKEELKQLGGKFIPRLKYPPKASEEKINDVVKPAKKDLREYCRTKYGSEWWKDEDLKKERLNEALTELQKKVGKEQGDGKEQSDGKEQGSFEASYQAACWIFNLESEEKLINYINKVNSEKSNSNTKNSNKIDEFTSDVLSTPTTNNSGYWNVSHKKLKDINKRIRKKSGNKKSGNKNSGNKRVLSIPENYHSVKKSGNKRVLSIPENYHSVKKQFIQDNSPYFTYMICLMLYSFFITFFLIWQNRDVVFTPEIIHTLYDFFNNEIVHENVYETFKPVKTYNISSFYRNILDKDCNIIENTLRTP
jgi:hypothetical protein